jgi:hypothetical protein
MNCYQPTTGQRCHCKPGIARDNCPNCEATGWVIDFKAIRARKSTVIGCDGSGPHYVGELRVLPQSSDPHHGNAILCRACYQQEWVFRKERNQELDASAQFDLPEWSDLKVYAEEAKA